MYQMNDYEVFKVHSKGLQKSPFTYRGENGILLVCFWKNFLKNFCGMNLWLLWVQKTGIPGMWNAGEREHQKIRRFLLVTW